MLLEDPESALQNARRLLKQDGKLALAAWTGPDDNLWSAAPARILQKRGLVEKPPPGPGQFAWADPNLIIETMESAGFVEPEVEAVDFVMHFEDVDDWWVAQTQMSTATGDADKRMDFATRSDVLAELEQAREPLHAARRQSGHPRPHVGRDGDRLTSRAHVLRRRRGSGPAQGQDRGDPGLRLPGPRPRPEPQGLRRRRRRRPARGLEVGRARQGRRPRGHRHRRRRQPRRHRDGAAPRREAPRRLRGVDQGRDRPRQPADVRPRVLDPLRARSRPRRRSTSRSSPPRARATSSAASTSRAPASRPDRDRLRTRPATPRSSRWPTPRASAARAAA